jgi:glycosyl transferase family 25
MNYIDKCYYINLESRTDRLNHIENQLKKMGLFDKSCRFNAIKHEFGALGCSMSHLEVLKNAKENNYKTIIIFEDDFEFLITKDEFESKLNYIFANLNFDVFMLSAYVKNYIKHSNTIKRVKFALTSAGYIIKNHYFDKIISETEKSLFQLENTRKASLYAYDIIWRKFQEKDQWFIFVKKIGKQINSYSDIEKRNVIHK